jgi:hypothetical protein
MVRLLEKGAERNATARHEMARLDSSSGDQKDKRFGIVDRSVIRH